ncbi:hypothetical protein Tco_0044282 [Tanacetum coccineum]
MCDVPLYNNPTLLEAFKDHSETIIDSQDDNLMQVLTIFSYGEDFDSCRCITSNIDPDRGDLTSIDLGIRKNASTTNVNVPLEDDQSSLFTYVDFPDCEDSRACSIHMSFTSSVQFGNPVSNLID